MTIPIQIPLISTSPPASPVANQQIRPKKPGEFEQILKKTCEISQAEAETVQSDQAVKDGPIHTYQMEVKPDTEERLKNISEDQAQIVDEAKDQVIPGVFMQTLPALEQIPITAPILGISIPDEAITPISTLETQTLIQGKGNEGVKTDPAGRSVNLQHAQYDGVRTADVEADIHLDQQGSPDTNGGEMLVGVPKDSSIKEHQQLKMDTVSAPALVTPHDDPQMPQAKISTESTVEPFDHKTARMDGVQASTVVPEPSATTKKETVNQTGNEFPVRESDQQVPLENVKHSKGESKTRAQEQPQTINAAVSNEVTVTAEKMKVEGEKVPFEAKPEIKVEMKPSPVTEGAEKPPPASSPGVVHEQLRMDAPIEKMVEPARLAEAQTTEILRQISRQIAGRFHAGSQTIRIQLHPEELGQIDLRITTTSQGTSISMVADQSSTGKLLESQITQLKQALTEAGIQMTDVHVGQQASQQSFRDQQLNQHSQRQSSFHSGAADPRLGETDQMLTESKLTQIDYRI